MRLAAGLRPHSLGSLSAPPDHLAAIGGGVPRLRGRERREGEKTGKEKGRGGEERVNGRGCFIGGWGKDGNVTSAWWQVTLCDTMWHVSSRSGVATLRTAMHLLLM